MVKFVIGGNWKMQTGIISSFETAKSMVKALKDIPDVDIFIAPPYTSLIDLRDVCFGSNIKVAAQNMCEYDIGAYTGEIAAEWLIEAGCTYVLLGHSERRKIFGESNETINNKIKKALKIGLKPVLCIGETAKERSDGKKFEVNEQQLNLSLKDITAEQMKTIVIAYEPVWGINSKGLNPVGEIRAATPAEAEEMHVFVRNWLVKKFGDAVGKEVPIQYGGSMNAANCEELLKIKDINGGLVGGASLKPADFKTIVETASKIKK
jgi:triosephosphate isomerase (TIM)